MCVCVRRAMRNAVERSRSYAEVQLGACNPTVHTMQAHIGVLCTSQGGNVIGRAWQTEIENKLLKIASVNDKAKNLQKKQQAAPAVRRSARKMQLHAASIWTVVGRSPLSVTTTKCMQLMYACWLCKPKKCVQKQQHNIHNITTTYIHRHN